MGNTVLTTNKTALGTDHIHNIHEFYDSAGNETIFSTGNNKILSGTTTLTDVTPGSYTITANDWKIVNSTTRLTSFNVAMIRLFTTTATAKNIHGSQRRGH